MDENDTLGGVPRHLIGEYHEATKDNMPENGIVEWLAKELIELRQVKNTVALGDVSGIDKDLGHGKCVEKGCERYAVKDYNGHGHWNCTPCYDSNERHFENEYR